MPGLEAQRAAIHEVVQSNPPETPPLGTLLTGWVIVAEWVDPDGHAWLSRFDGPKDGMTNWKRRGMLHEALADDWGSDSEENG